MPYLSSAFPPWIPGILEVYCFVNAMTCPFPLRFHHTFTDNSQSRSISDTRRHPGGQERHRRLGRHDLENVGCRHRSRDRHILLPRPSYRRYHDNRRRPCCCNVGLGATETTPAKHNESVETLNCFKMMSLFDLLTRAHFLTDVIKMSIGLFVNNNLLHIM